MTESMKIAGVMGWPVEHSLSPRLHTYWLNAYGIKGEYRLLPVRPENLRDELKALAAKGFAGVNLTVPHKEAAMGVLDAKDNLVEKIGATNTIVMRNGKLFGMNTDVYGFAQNLLSAGFKPAKSATLLGAGGAARAAVAALLDMGFTDIRIVNRTRANADNLAGAFDTARIKTYDWGDRHALEGVSLLANSTSLGLKNQPPLEIDLTGLPKDAWVTDMVYAPLETDLLKRAKERGNKTVDGLGMLLHQARPAFKEFFGVDPDVTPELRAHVLEKIAC